MFGVIIENGIKDWQIIQHENGFGNITLNGSYQVPKAAIKVGVESATPVIRVLREDDNSQIIPWTKVDFVPHEDGTKGTWNITLQLIAGGLYRIETGLDTKSTKPDLGWMFRGDVRLHIGVGDIFIIAGQSNSSGYGKDSAMDVPDLNVHLYRNRGSWDLASHPINESTFTQDCVNTEMGVSGVSPYISFGKSFHHLSHYPVGLIPTALGGSPISRWDVLQKGDLFRNMIAKAKECDGKVAGVLWYQGCSDTNPIQAASYYDNFKRLVTETRKELGYNIPFFTFQLNRQINGENDEGWGMIREAQRRANKDIQGVYILPTINCSLSDSIHNNARSSIMLGEKMAKLCGNILYQTSEFLAPNVEKAILKGNNIKVTFQNMKRGFAVISDLPTDSGFMVKDTMGIIQITSYRPDNLQLNALTLILERIPVGDTTLSFAWEANPTAVPIMDEVTYLPPLSFYQLPVDTLQVCGCATPIN